MYADRGKRLNRLIYIYTRVEAPENPNYIVHRPRRVSSRWKLSFVIGIESDPSPG